MNEPDSIHTWYDALADVWAIDDGRGGLVRSFHAFDKDELPAAITPTMTPCALSYPTGMRPQYSTGGPTIFFWAGRTDFHLTEDVKPANAGYVMRFFSRIVAAAAGHISLGGTVDAFLLVDEDDALTFVTYKDAQGLDSHQGISVRWAVKQPVSGQYEVKA